MLRYLIASFAVLLSACGLQSSVASQTKWDEVGKRYCFEYFNVGRQPDGKNWLCFEIDTTGKTEFALSENGKDKLKSIA